MPKYNYSASSAHWILERPRLKYNQRLQRQQLFAAMFLHMYNHLNLAERTRYVFWKIGDSCLTTRHEKIETYS